MRLVAAAAVVMAMSSCAATRSGGSGSRPSPQPSGAGLYVFLHGAALRDDASADVAAAWAKREDGGLAPLQVAAPPAAGTSAPPDRLWLSGSLPAGAYVGFELGLRSRADEPPESFPIPFVVTPDAGTVLSAEVRPAPRARDAPGGVPDVVFSKPARIATGLLGLASVRGWEAVALFDKRTGRVASVLQVGRAPAGLAIDTEHLRAYVTVAGDDAVAVLDLQEERVRERVTLRGGDLPLDAALTPDGRTLVVANSGSDTVSFVDTGAAVEVDRIAVGARPVSVVMSRDGHRAFVVAERAGAVTVVDVTSRAVIGSIATDTGPVQARLGGRSGELLFVVHGASPYLIAADTSSLATVRRVYVGNGARAIEVDPRTGRIFLARAKTRMIETYDTSSLLPIDTIEVPGDAVYLAVETEGSGLGVLLGDTREADIIGIVGRKILIRTGLGPDPSALRFVEAR